MNDQKSFFLSKTLWGLLFTALAPWLSKKFGLTLDDAAQQAVLDDVIRGVGLLYSAYGRVVAKHDVTVPVVKPPLGLWLALCLSLGSGCASIKQQATSKTNPDGSEERTVSTRVFALGDAKQAVEKLNTSSGKTVSAGATGANQEATSESLKTLLELLKALGGMRP